MYYIFYWEHMREALKQAKGTLSDRNMSRTHWAGTIATPIPNLLSQTILYQKYGYDLVLNYANKGR